MIIVFILQQSHLYNVNRFKNLESILKGFLARILHFSNGMRANSVGQIDEIVLLAVCVLNGNAYGETVKREVEKYTGRKHLLGGIHYMLYRLQHRGFLRSSLGGSTSMRGGRRKRLFKITALGGKELKSVHDARQQMWRIISGRRLL